MAQTTPPPTLKAGDCVPQSPATTASNSTLLSPVLSNDDDDKLSTASLRSSDFCFDLFAEAETEAASTSSSPAPSSPSPQQAPAFVFGSRSFALPSPSGPAVSSKIWASALISADFIHRQLATWLRGKRVLEVGCGSGFAGIVAALHGPRSVTFTDCADGALITLSEWIASESTRADNNSIFPREDLELRTFHHLWEVDLEEAPLEPRHWSNSQRLHQHPACQPLPDAEKDFDLIIASDCLYFPSQELPLAAVLRRRLGKEGLALLVVQTRCNGAFQAERLRETLEAGGFAVEIVGAESLLGYAELERRYVVKAEGGGQNCPGGETDGAGGSLEGGGEAGAEFRGSLGQTGKERGEQVMVVRWRKEKF